MSRLVILLESEYCANLLLALAHTLWQAALAAGILFLYLRQAPAEAVNKRYVAGVAALGAVVLGALLTWSILRYAPADAAHGPGEGLVTEGAGVATSAPAASGALSSHAGSPAPKAGSAARAPRSRQVWIMGAWLAGVALMLVRVVATVVRTGRLCGQCRPVEDAKTLEIIEQLRDRIGISRRVRVLVSERITVPGVIGCFWPTLLLPVSMVSGIPAEDLRAILAHELAHIRRHDYLVNFFQMIAEALLFFNPAVWWISRQIRIEREACCDAAGVRWTGQCTRYAEVLVAWAHRIGRERYGAPDPGVGFGRTPDRGGILDRVRRIVIPGHQPRPRMPWHIAAALIVLALACLLLIRHATDLAVGLAGRILTPQERIDRIATISEEYGRDNREYGPEDRVEVSGVVRTWDGAPLPDRTDVRLWYVARRSSGVIAATLASQDGTFRTSSDYGRICVIASAEGYQPAFAGPFEPEPGGRLDGLELVLGDGFPGRIRIIDDTGQPIEGADLVGGYVYPESRSWSHTIILSTDVNGIAAVQHAAAREVALTIEADGFESTRVEDLVLSPDEVTVLTLARAQPVTGAVLSEVTGLPIAGAAVRILGSSRGTHSHSENYITGEPDAVTDTDGRFKLTRLRRDRTYLLHAQAPGYGYRYLWGVNAGDNDVTVSLGPRKIIRGRITGDLSLLPTDRQSGEPVIHVENSYHYPSSGYADASRKCPVTVRDGVGYFEINDFWGQKIALYAGPERVLLDIEEDRLDDIVIDLSPSMRRQVVLRFLTPQGAPPIEGTVRIDYITDRAKQQGQGMTPGWIDIEGGRAQCEIPVPAEFKYGIDFHKGQRPVGWWFHEAVPVRILPGEEPFAIDVPVLAAGAIYGRVLRPDGSIAADAHTALIIARKLDIESQQNVSFSGLFDALSNRPDQGTYNATPLPLGGQYAIVAYEGNVFAASDVFSLDETNPIINADLALPQGVALHGRLLDADANPAVYPVVLNVSIQRGTHSWGRSSEPAQPDEMGRFVFTNVNPGPAGSCFIMVEDLTGYRPVRQEVADMQKPVTIRLEKGLVVTGTVTDDESGWPVPDAEVYALWTGRSERDNQFISEVLEADARTDSQGRFAFSNMAGREYRINVRGANLVDPRQEVLATGGQSKPVVLRVRIREGSRLKPRRP